MNSAVKKFIIVTLAVMGIGILFVLIYVVKTNSNLKHDDRSNAQCLTTQRLFDYADKLTDSEESELLSDMEKLEDKTGMDVVVAIIDDDTDLSDAGINDLYDTRTVAEQFCDYYKFGWEDWSTNNGTATSSIVVVTNWGDNVGYTNAWMCTSGRAKSLIGDVEAQDIVDDGCEILRSNPLEGYQRMLDGALTAMKNGGGSGPLLEWWMCIIASLVISVIFFVVNFSKKAGKDTTNASTYSEGNAQVLDRRDIFIRKEVHSVKISSESSGGHGGGSHGGGSHGGGGGHF